MNTRVAICILLVVLSGCESPLPSEPLPSPPEYDVSPAEVSSGFTPEVPEPEANAERDAAEAAEAETEKIAISTKSYWDRCADINQRFVSEKSGVWFKEFRPGAVEATCKEAAKRLREVDVTNVDPLVIDHVSRAIRGYETMGAIAKVKGKESLISDAKDGLMFIYEVSKSRKSESKIPSHGAYADGGWLEMGLGVFVDGKVATSEGQEQTTAIASSTIESEEAVIRAMREKYGIELRPW